MSVIKEIYDVAKDASQLKGRIKSIKKALKTELKLNKKFLFEIEKSKLIDNDRRKNIIEMLEIKELTDAVKYDIPYKLICKRKVNNELAEKLKIKRIIDFNFEKLIESQYLKISYLKKDYNNKNIDLNSRLLYIYKYNSMLLKLLI